MRMIPHVTSLDFEGICMQKGRGGAFVISHILRQGGG